MGNLKGKTVISVDLTDEIIGQLMRGECPKGMDREVYRKEWRKLNRKTRMRLKGTMIHASKHFNQEGPGDTYIRTEPRRHKRMGRK